MLKFSKLLAGVREKERPMALIASLPVNDPSLAQAALDGGADVVKVHIHMEHRASHTRLGNLQEERVSLESILKIFKGHPCGIVPGNDPALLNIEEMEQLYRMGFNFISLYLRDAALDKLLPSAELERMWALAWEDPLDLAAGLDEMDLQAVELSIMAKETYGQPLTALDLTRYAFVRSQTNKPLVVPSQHSFSPASLSELACIGVEGVMLGTIVAGNTPQSWKETFRNFRNEMDRLFKKNIEIHN